jgi:hypothetical protein
MGLAGIPPGLFVFGGAGLSWWGRLETCGRFATRWLEGAIKNRAQVKNLPHQETRRRRLRSGFRSRGQFDNLIGK